MLKKSFVLLLIIIFTSLSFAQYSNRDKTDWEGGVPEGCTSITVGKDATSDGSVITSHTCDSHRTRGFFDIMPPKEHSEDMMELVMRVPVDSFAMPTYGYVPSGKIPQVEKTYGYINTAYPAMNEHQLAIGESTFGGREELKSDSGMIDCQQLVALMLQRCTTAKEAITLTGELLDKYGWNDYGECLTIADTKEVWHLEIVGPGQGLVGAHWVAQRVPDDHISVNANASRIRTINLDKPDYYMASKNVSQMAQDSGWWNPDNGEFEFCYAYADRNSLAARRREWRVLALAAPSLELDANAENYPFSVKPDELITMETVIDMFQDYYEGTPYNFVKNITWVNEDGEHEISPLANPFMPYDMNKIFDINGGWDWRGERTIARWYTMYATITQSRDWLPDEVGGVVWLAWDNVATSIYIPIYCSVTDVAPSYKKPARREGYNCESAYWAFNRLGTLTAQRWGDMRHDVTAVFEPMQTELLNKQVNEFDKKAQELLKEDVEKMKEYVTNIAIEWGEKVAEEAWKLGDFLWTKYDEKW